MTDYDCNPKDMQEYESRHKEEPVNPYEKKAFIGYRNCTLHKDNSGGKYIKWTEDGEYHVLYEYELEEMLNRVKQYKGE